MRHKAPNGKLWMMPPIIATAGHGFAALLNVRTMHQLSSSREKSAGRGKLPTEVRLLMGQDLSAGAHACPGSEPG